MAVGLTAGRPNFETTYYVCRITHLAYDDSWIGTDGTDG
jgi:hypothetical protein